MSAEMALVYNSMAVNAEDAPHRTPLPADAPDAAFVARARAGDFEAFEMIVRRYRNDVYGLAHHYVRNREDAWDISQEVFVRAFKAIGRFRGDANIKTWLLRITSNRCKDFFKRGKLNTVPLDEAINRQATGPVVKDPAAAAEAKELGRAIESALDTLPEKHRLVLVLREFEGLSYEEMAGVMKCSIGTVMSRLYHARKKMQNALITMGVVEESGNA